MCVVSKGYASVSLWRQTVTESLTRSLRRIRDPKSQNMTLCNPFLLKTSILPHSHFFTHQFSTFSNKPQIPIFSLSCSATPSSSSSSVPDHKTNGSDDNANNGGAGGEPKKKRLSDQSSWEAEDSEGEDYLYRLGKEADNMNIAVGARAGAVDDLFVGKFLGRDSDIVFDYRQKVTRSFQYLQGDYYIAPLFMVWSY